MRDFFERQERARRSTRRLIGLFALAVSLIVLCVYLAVRGVVFWQSLDELSAGQPFLLWDPAVFAAVAAATLMVILGGSLYKIRSLRTGGRGVAELLGGRLVAPGSARTAERRLLNVVEEMAIASGLPVPDVYLLEGERGINAFAAGFSVDDAVICVTRGALELLGRDELQGVVAHEFSHILNGDTLINLRLLGWLHGLLMISLLGEGLLRGLGWTRSRRGGAFIVLGFALYLSGLLGVFCGNLIKRAVSRQREWLADAAAVQFTRNPAGLSGALKKIGGLVGAGRIRHPRAMEASHMFFCGALRESWSALTATHPPLLGRILRLEPGFDGLFPAVEGLPAPQSRYRRPLPRKSPSPKPVEVVSGAAAVAILETVGAPMARHAELARRLIASLPGPVREGVRDPLSACALVCRLLLDDDPAVSQRQLAGLREADPALASATERLAGQLPRLEPRLRLPLIDLALPALRRLSHGQYGRFKKEVDRLIHADRRLSLFEFVLQYVLVHRLDRHFGERRPAAVQIYGLRGVLEECSCVLSLLARAGHREEPAAEEAFERGRRILRDPRGEPEFIPADACTPKNLREALEVLSGTSFPIRRKLLAACLECLVHDGVVEAREAELFRAVAEALDCPVPPWAGGEIATRDEGVGGFGS